MVRIGAVRVGIVDVGANTLRLLVAARENGRLVPLREQRVQLGLGSRNEGVRSALTGGVARVGLPCPWLAVARPGGDTRDVLQTMSEIAILVLAETLVLIAGKMDLSLESTFGLAPGIAAWLVVKPGVTHGLGLGTPDFLPRALVDGGGLRLARHQ